MSIAVACVDRPVDKNPGSSTPLLANAASFGLPLRVHYIVKDHEVNRRFLEDLLGIPLIATRCEQTYRANLGREAHFCHTFFGLADGRTLAFLQFDDPEMYALIQAKERPEVGGDYHIALKAGDQTYEELKSRLNAAGEKFRETDRGDCKSIYTTSQAPSGPGTVYPLRAPILRSRRFSP